jgi:hypothetical protein
MRMIILYQEPMLSRLTGAFPQDSSINFFSQKFWSATTPYLLHLLCHSLELLYICCNWCESEEIIKIG